MAVFRPELQPGDAPSDDPFLPVPRPGTPLVRCSALAADQQLGQSVPGGVFALLGFAGLLHHLPLVGAAGHLRLHPLEHVLGDDPRMVPLHVIHGQIPQIFHDLLADAVGGVRLLQQSVAIVFFIVNANLKL